MRSTAGLLLAMLNTLSPSVMSAPPPGVPRPPILHRRRGGQPSNRNAFIHGVYAAKKPTPLTRFSSSIAHARKMPDRSSEFFRQTIRDLQDLYCHAMELRNKAEITRSVLAWDKLAAKTLRTIIRLKFAWIKQELPMRNLHLVSKYCLGIIRVNIDDLGISRDADSFRAKLEDSDFTSFAFQESFCASLSYPPYPFLTPRQWHILAPLLPPPDPIRRRGRPPVDPRELLDAVFWKLAHKARWQDLPDYYPPMLSCRRYYRRLFLSGRLTTLYSALYQDLLARGEAALTQIVHQRFFTVTEKMLTLPPGLNEIWQLRTALLFLQLGYQAFRRVSREAKLKRRLGFTSCRILSMEKFTLNPPLIKYSKSSFIPMDLACPSSLLPRPPISKPRNGGSLRGAIRSAHCLKKVTLIQPSALEFQCPPAISTETAPLFPAGEKNDYQFY